MYSLCCDQQLVLDCGVLLLITAFPERTLYKYRNRGMRFIYMDTGHLGQNIYLAATGEDLGACALGGFYDYEIENFLEIDGFHETMVYALTVGTRSQDGGEDESQANLEEAF
jgi:SagB-type dehydrogenase family enzyme